MIYYKKTQNGFWISSILLIIAIATLLFGWLQVGSKPMPFTLSIVLALLFVVFYIIFRKLTITINETSIRATFGLGLIKQRFPLKDINLDTIEKIKVPFIYGIGIRLTPKGILYNVKLGHAIRITSQQKTFFVGTDDFDGIKQTLLELKKLQIIN